MDKQPSGREDYVRKVLEAYRNTPGTCGNLGRQDRLLAVQFYQRAIPLTKVQYALSLSAGRPAETGHPYSGAPLFFCLSNSLRMLSGLRGSLNRTSNS